MVPITPNSVRVNWTPLGEQHWSGDTRTGGYRVRYQPLTDFPTALQQTMKQDVMGIKVQIMCYNNKFCRIFLLLLFIYSYREAGEHMLSSCIIIIIFQFWDTIVQYTTTN